MKTPVEFDYDLWTTEDNGNKKYWVRVKRTGEVSEVDIVTMRFLRSEEKAFRRSFGDNGGEKAKDTAEQYTVLSLDYYDEDETGTSWLADPCDVQEEITFKIMEEKFMSILTDKQLDVYLNCMKAGVSRKRFALLRGVGETTIQDLQTGIRKKYKKYFS